MENTDGAWCRAISENGSFVDIAEKKSGESATMSFAQAVFELSEDPVLSEEAYRMTLKEGMVEEIVKEKEEKKAKKQKFQ